MRYETVHKQLEIVHTSDKAEALALLNAGYCGVELSIGGETVVLPDTPDAQIWDHHNQYAHLGSVGKRSYLPEFFGSRRLDPRFVVTGKGDADATLCVANLAGLLPHPSRAEEFSKMPWLAPSMTKDCSAYVEMVDRIDTRPYGVRLSETREGLLLLFWGRLMSGANDATSFYAGVDHHRMILGARPPEALIEATRIQDAERLRVVDEAGHTIVSDDVVLAVSPEWGMDVWWEIRPVVCWVNPGQMTDNLLISVRDVPTACRLFGPDGLGGILKSNPQLKGCGGHKDAGGGPRGANISAEHAHEIAKVLASVIK